MKILALDTSTALCGVAALCLESGDGGRAAVRREGVTTHSEMLLRLCAGCLDELGLKPGDLSGVVCGAGPGSFTGLRIGLATAKGLCFALGVPLVLVSSLEALARRGGGERPVLAVLDAFRGQVFARLQVPAGAPEPAVAAVLARHPQLAGDAVYTPEALVEAVRPLAGSLLVCGGGLDRHPGLARDLPGCQRLDEDPAPHPLDLARLGAARLGRGEVADLRSVVPNYLCASAPEEALREAAAKAARLAAPPGPGHAPASVGSEGQAR